MASFHELERKVSDLELLANQLASMGDRKGFDDAFNQIAATIKARERARIKENIQPDGTPMDRRKSSQKANAQIAFLYERADGFKAIRNIRSYRDDGDRYIGFDRYRGAIRTFLKHRVLRTISIDKSKVTTRTSQKKMFKGLIRAQWLKSKLTREGAIIYFAGVADRIAAVHHFGEKDRPSPKAAEVRYPERQLLGITAEDAKIAEGILIDAITNASKR